MHRLSHQTRAIPRIRTPAMAAQGKLLSMTAAEKPLFERVHPVLECYSEIVLHVGETIGRGHELKLLNNFLATVMPPSGRRHIPHVLHRATTRRYFTQIVSGGGNNCQNFQNFEIVSGGGNNCQNFQNFSKYPLNGDADSHKFAIANCAKDMDYYTRFADELGQSTIISDGVRQLYKLAAAAGCGEQYVPALTKFVRELNGGTMKG